MKINDRYRLNPHWLAAGILGLVLIAGSVAVAQEMPPPRSSPRTPVNREALPGGGKGADVAKSRDVSGPATIIDGEHLRIGDIDLRLFGIVPPQLSASFGPQARAALDQLARGQIIDCHVRDRDHDGRFLATCATATTKEDLALELLKRGLAVTARGSLQPTELAASYEAAEDAAQTQKLGLWSTAVPAAANPATATVPKTETSNVPPLPSELKKEEKPAPIVVAVPPAATTAAATNFTNQLLKAPSPMMTSISVDDDSDAPGFVARYQLFITGLVVLATALGIVFVLAAERRRDRRDEMKAIAAALRGELLAARAVCQARLKTWIEADNKTAAWPRIRATLYQAYVGRIGWLGAALARQIASIYGLASDYAAYFNPNGGGNGGEAMRTEAVSKRQALQALVQHIEEVLPKLAAIEQSGMRPKGGSPLPPAGGYVSATEPAASYVANDPAAYEVPSYAPASNNAAMTSPAPPLWDIVKKFAQMRRVERKPAAPEHVPDYTTLIEEEMARMSSEEESSVHQRNVTKMRTGA